MPQPLGQQLKAEAAFLLSKQAAITAMIQNTQAAIQQKKVKLPENVAKEFIRVGNIIIKEFKVLAQNANPVNYKNSQRLEATLNKLNTNIAHFQFIDFSPAPGSRLHLSFLTRLTAQFVKYNKRALGTVKALYLNARGTQTDPKDLDNKIYCLPENMNAFKQLEILYARYNCLTTLPISIAKLNQLKELGLEGNQITALPAEIGDLESLEELGVDRNKLRELPEQIGKLQKLRILGLDKNFLTALPPVITQLKNLEILGANNNFLMEIPELTALKALQVVGVKNNLLTQFPLMSERKQGKPVKVDARKNAFKDPSHHTSMKPV